MHNNKCLIKFCHYLVGGVKGVRAIQCGIQTLAIFQNLSKTEDHV